MILVMKKKTAIIAIIIVVAVIACCVACGLSFRNEPTALVGQKIIVIDAGHGGIDKGVIGKNGTIEAEKNLEISKMLQDVFEKAGFFVVMTRTTNDGADKPLETFKKEDFERRKNTIEKANPDMVISIHCNKFPTRERRGIQVFFNQISDIGESYANSLQEKLNALNSEYVNRDFSALKGEYFMLNCTEAPSAIIECGFLSNPDDEILLNDKSYLEKLTYAIYDGTISFLEGKNNQQSLIKESINNI